MKQIKILIRKMLGIVLMAILLNGAGAAMVLAQVAPFSIHLTYVLPDTEFKLYHVAERPEPGIYRRTNAFAECPVAIEAWAVRDKQVLATTLSAYIRRGAIAADETGIISERGSVDFVPQKGGLYLLMGESTCKDGYFYIPSPVILSLDEDGEDRTIPLDLKYEKRGTDKPLELKVHKVWADGDSKQRPTFVEAELLCDGMVKETVELNSANHWDHTWTGLPADHSYEVVEKTVPAGYGMTISREGSQIVIQNRLRPWCNLPGEPNRNLSRWPDKRLPQTGQIRWPFPILGLGALLLLNQAVIEKKREKNGRFKRGRAKIRGAGLLLTVAVSLWGYNHMEACRAEKTSDETVKQLSVLLENQEGMSSTHTALQDVAPPTICVDGEYYLGELRIKSLGLELPVMDDWDYTRLKKAPCRYYGSVYAGDLVIAAHNYYCHFGSLQQLTQGDAVEFIDAQGVTHQFCVTDTAILKPQEVDRLIRNEDETWELSLFTCTQSGQARYVVRCHSL